jgi:selenocysteine-specific elongation factor
LPDVEALEPGHESMAQLRTDSPIVPSAGDRFVIRSLSPSVTLGGGVILNPRGVKLKARTTKVFANLDQEDQQGIVLALIRSGGLDGCPRRELLGLSGLSAKALDAILQSLLTSRIVARFDPAEDRLVHSDFVKILKKKIMERLDSFHAENPLKDGMPKQELRSNVPGEDKLFRKVMDLLIAEEDLVDQGDSVRSSKHKVRLKEEEKTLKAEILRMIVQGGNAPPLVKEIIAGTKAEARQVRNLLDILEKENKVVRIKEDMYFSAGFMKEIREKLVEFIHRQGSLTPSQFHEITGSSRKYNIPLLEYFDRQRFTIRVGDQRVLRGSLT